MGIKKRTSKRIRNVVSFALVLALMLVSYAVPATAAQTVIVYGRNGIVHGRDDILHGGNGTSDASISLFYKLISSLRGTCFIEGGKIHMSGTVSSAGLATYAKVTLTLQVNTGDGSGWQYVDSWSATGTTSATKNVSYTPSSKVLYRLKVYGYVSNASTSESDTIYSNSVAL